MIQMLCDWCGDVIDDGRDVKSSSVGIGSMPVMLATGKDGRGDPLEVKVGWTAQAGDGRHICRPCVRRALVATFAAKPRLAEDQPAAEAAS